MFVQNVKILGAVVPEKSLTQIRYALTLKAPRKTASENVVCLCLQKWLLKSQADDKADDNCCDWRFKG